MDKFIEPIRNQGPSLIASGLALYFAAAFGLGGAGTLLQLHQGATDYGAVVLVQAFGFTPDFAAITTVAAAIGAAKLAVAGFFILAVTERSAAAIDGEPQWEYGALEVALQGAVALLLVQALSAWLLGDAATVRMHMAHALLVGVAVAASRCERDGAMRMVTRVGQLDRTSATPISLA